MRVAFIEADIVTIYYFYLFIYIYLNKKSALAAALHPRSHFQYLMLPLHFKN